MADNDPRRAGPDLAGISTNWPQTGNPARFAATYARPRGATCSPSSATNTTPTRYSRSCSSR